MVKASGHHTKNIQNWPFLNRVEEFSYSFSNLLKFIVQPCPCKHQLAPVLCYIDWEMATLHTSHCYVSGILFTHYRNETL
jgi:hypothetical protein